MLVKGAPGRHKENVVRSDPPELPSARPKSDPGKLPIAKLGSDKLNSDDVDDEDDDIDDDGEDGGDDEVKD